MHFNAPIQMAYRMLPMQGGASVENDVIQVDREVIFSQILKQVRDSICNCLIAVQILLV